MSFDLEAAKARVSRELEDIIAAVWPDIEEGIKGDGFDEHLLKHKDKAHAVYYKQSHIKDRQKQMMFSMLNELMHDCFWHADDYWPELKDILPKESQKFYANFMLELAKDQNKVKERTFGYGWIVEAFHEGPLAEFIDEELLTEAVNRGFWEAANDQFRDDCLTVPRRYETIVKYLDKLDLSRVNEFKQEPLGDESGWLSQEYLDCFERARNKLSIEDGAWLARPIIQRYISCTLSWEEPEGDPKRALEKEIKPYKEYIDTALIQELIKKKIKENVELIGEDAYHYPMCVEILSKYWKGTKEEFKNIINENLPIDDSRIERDILDATIPIEWLNEDILSKIQDNFIDYFEMEPDKKTDALICDLGLIQRAMRFGFLDKDIAKEKIESKIEEYLAMKRRPGGAIVANTLEVLDPKYIDTGLYRRFVHQGISDLVKRNKIDEASLWYSKAEHEGWLDKTKVPNFKKTKKYKPKLN